MTTSDFEAYALARQREGASNGTINRELALVRRALNLARRAGRLLHVPYVTQLAEAKPRTGFFSSGEIAALLEQLPAHLKPVVKFGYLTGWRLREVLGLQWSNVDFEAGEVRLNMSKNG
jgi:integrase